jgi:hypothetical protein
MPKLKLFEAKPREFMSDLEKKLKRKLVNLLRDDGKGHHHAKYAERLELFDIQIVPLKVDPGFTAAISFDRGIIMIGEGFLTDPDTFYQLNVLMRHELAHNLLMHQIRMAYKLGEPVYNHTSLSGTLHRLQNIIADDEISNRKYSEEDKSIVRNMILNGKEIGGLVTEDHRKDWINMSIEEMYDQLCAEIAAIHKKLKDKKAFASIDSEIMAAEASGDLISREILQTYIYTDINSGSLIKGTLKDFVAKGCSIDGKRLSPIFREIVEQIYKALEGVVLNDEEVKELLEKVATSSPTEKVDLFDDGAVELFTPEEKYMAVEVLKKYKSEYAEWFDKVIAALGEDFTADELRELLSVLK